MITCDEARVLLHGLLDGELDGSHAREVEVHVAGCPRCAAEFAQFRAMREAMSGPNFRLAAPAALRSRIEAMLPAEPSRAAAPSRRSLLRGFAYGTALSAIAATGVVFMVVRSDQDQQVLGDVVSAHLRSLQGDHLTDVRSTDQSAVKPWFSGKLAVAPPVIDLTAQGFTLLGGRLDDHRRQAGGGDRLPPRRARHQSVCRAGREHRPHRRARTRRCKASTPSAGAIRACASSRSATSTTTNCGNSTTKFEAALRAGAELQTGVVNRVVPSRSMRGRRSTSQDRYSFMASLVLPARS